MSVHTSFRLQSLEICCTDTLRLAQAIEIAELLRLAVDYYHYQQVELRCHPQRVSAGGLRLLHQAIRRVKGRGIRVRLSASKSIRDALVRPHVTRPQRREIGFRITPERQNTQRSIR